MRKCLILLSFFAIIGCASLDDEQVETARFALDRGNWSSAIANASEVLERDPSNTKAALIISSAYAGRGGFRLLDLASLIANNLHRRDTFDIVHDFNALVGSLDMADVRTAIETLRTRVNPVPAYGHVHFIDYHVQLGVLMLVEAFTLPSYAAQPIEDGPIDASAITEEMKEIVLDDLLGFDDNLVEAGLSEDDGLVKNARVTFCVLQNASETDEGFDLAAFRDLVLCHLSPDDGASLGPDDFESALITSCNDFDYEACSSVGDTEQ